MINLRDTLAQAILKHFSPCRSLTPDELFARHLADACLVALRDYPPSVNMCEVWSDLHPTAGLATEWHYMIDAEIDAAECADQNDRIA